MALLQPATAHKESHVELHVDEPTLCVVDGDIHWWSHFAQTLADSRRNKKVKRAPTHHTSHSIFKAVRVKKITVNLILDFAASVSLEISSFYASLLQQQTNERTHGGVALLTLTCVDAMQQCASKRYIAKWHSNSLIRAESSLALNHCGVGLQRLMTAPSTIERPWWHVK